MANNHTHPIDNSPLGKSCSYISQYSPELLFSIERKPKRLEIGITHQPIFFGADIWTAFEVSWLNKRGKPQLAIAHITIPSESPFIIESKSFKLYLNSFNNTVFNDENEVINTLKKDISSAVWFNSDINGTVGIKLITPQQFDAEPIEEMSGINLDRLDIDCHFYTPQPHLLQTLTDTPPVSEVLVSRLLKSNCLVTGQPDWASIQISYQGAPINQEGLLQYLISFRNHNEFHEQCVERIFMDIWARCKPLRLSVYARYTRRGGLDINPYRTSYPTVLPANIRTARQ